jgi:hypothetical protein
LRFQDRAHIQYQMELDVTLRHDEVVELLAQFAPVRIHLTEGDEDRRWVELEPPSQVSFAPGEGIRIVTRGRLRHELAGVGLPFDIRRLQILFAPEVVPGHHGQRLDFRLRIEQADLENVPGVVEAVIIAKVNQVLDPEHLGMYWELAQSLALRVSMPERFEPLDSFLTTARSAYVTVTHDSLILRLSLGLGMSRTRARPIDGPTPSE